MPTYQYTCTACGQKHEAVQAFSDAPLTECPACGGALRKVFSAVGVVFKGSGFYRTDSRPAASATSGDGGKDAGGATKTGAGKADAGKGGSPAAGATPAPASSSAPAASSGDAA